MNDERDFFEELEENLEEAANAIAQAEALLIGAGAGIGVDSGLPDFRGDAGFWSAYPIFREQAITFELVADPKCFKEDPTLAWGFYGHRLELYRRTTPHPGFDILKEWTKGKDHFVFTSNVDGQFQKAGFRSDSIYECHGSLHHIQCMDSCSIEIYDSEFSIEIDPRTLKASGPLPNCPRCKSLARPNVLLFDDGDWNWERSRLQEQAYYRWLKGLEGKRLVVIECGAGTAIPTVREACESSGGKLIRINPRDYQVPPGQIAIALGSLAALQGIAKRF